MGNEPNDLRHADGIALDSLPKWLRDLIDINNEMAGRGTGRAQRFLNAGEHGPDSEKEEEEKEERRFNELMRLLQDPEYARLYQEAVNTIGDIEDAAARALAKLDREGEIVSQRLEELRNAAAELPDGRKIFLDEDGRLYAEDGTDVTDQKDSVRGLSANTTRLKDYKQARESAEDVERRKREIEGYLRDDIDPFKRRLADPDNPITPDEIRLHLQDGKDKMPADIVRAREQRAPDEASKFSNTSAPVNSSAADELVPAKGINAPDMFAQFRSASAVVPDDASAAPAPSSAPKAS